MLFADGDISVVHESRVKVGIGEVANVLDIKFLADQGRSEVSHRLIKLSVRINADFLNGTVFPG